MFLNGFLFGRFVFALLLLAAGAVHAAAPVSSTVTYNLLRNGIQLAVITEQFEVKDGAYRASSEAHATGLFALVQRDPARYISTGALTAEGLRPRRFEGHHRGKSMFADFDWPAARLNLAHDGLNHALDLPRVHVVGTSLGGILTMLMASTHPERIAGAVLVDVGPEIDPAGLSRIRGYVGKANWHPTWMHAARAYAELNAAVYPDYDIHDWLRITKRTHRLTPEGRIVTDYDKQIAAPLRLAGDLAFFID